MKFLFTGAIAIVLTTAAIPTITARAEPISVPLSLTAASSSQAIDEAAIAVIINSVATFADQGEFGTIETLYADEIQVDYTSLWGGEVQTHTPISLMTAWASVLPGFEQTYHDISNVQVVIEGDRATATADVTADHYLDANYWQVVGQYEYRLVKQAEEWLITDMTFILVSETGDRAIVNLAGERAALEPDSYLQQPQAQQVVRDFLTSLETKDMDAFAAVWTEDAVQDMPFSPEGFPKRVEGRENLIQHYAAWPEISGSANFTDELVFYPMADPTLVFAEWRGVVDIIPTGRRYEQRYGGLFRIVDGQIQLFREYYDPIVFRTAFGLDENDAVGN
ncbi:MAG: nuclear transport factor 2 family protein [Cyanobacteria bacterium P01_H01_bin.121]